MHKHRSMLFLALLTVIGSITISVEALGSHKKGQQKLWTQNVFLALEVDITPLEDCVNDINRTIQQRLQDYQPYTKDKHHVTLVAIGAVTKKNKNKVVAAINQYMNTTNMTRVGQAINAMQLLKPKECGDLFGITSPKKFVVLKFNDKNLATINKFCAGLKEALDGQCDIVDNDGNLSAFHANEQALDNLHVSIGSYPSSEGSISRQEVQDIVRDALLHCQNASLVKPRLVLYTTVKNGRYKKLASWQVSYMPL